jgi:hypothetical protein
MVRKCGSIHDEIETLLDLILAGPDKEITL